MCSLTRMKSRSPQVRLKSWYPERDSETLFFFGSGASALGDVDALVCCFARTSSVRFDCLITSTVKTIAFAPRRSAFWSKASDCFRSVLRYTCQNLSDDKCLHQARETQSNLVKQRLITPPGLKDLLQTATRVRGDLFASAQHSHASVRRRQYHLDYPFRPSSFGEIHLAQRVP